MRAHDGAQHVVRVVDALRPLAERGRHGVLERGRALVHRVHARAQEAHAVHVERLALGVLAAHEHLALHAHERRRRGGGHSVLASARLGDEAGLPHPLCQQRLAQHVVDLVRARMVQVLALQVYLRAAQILRHAAGEVEARRAPRVVVQQVGELAVERGIPLAVLVGFLQLAHGAHQQLGDVLAPVDAEPSLGHGLSSLPSPSAARRPASSLPASRRSFPSAGRVAAPPSSSEGHEKSPSRQASALPRTSL